MRASRRAREAASTDRYGEARVGRGVVRGEEEVLRLQLQLELTWRRLDAIQQDLLQAVALRLQLPLRAPVSG